MLRRETDKKTRAKTPYIIRTQCLYQRMILDTTACRADAQRRISRPPRYPIPPRYEQSPLHRRDISGCTLSHDRRISSPLRASTSRLLRIQTKQSNMVQYSRRGKEGTPCRRLTIHKGSDVIPRHKILFYRRFAEYHLSFDRNIRAYHTSKMPCACTKTG